MGRMTAFMAILPCFMLLFGTRGFYVYGSCMEPNLKTGERVLAIRFAYMLSGPKRGDIVIFKYPCDPSKNYVKRVIGLPGDKVEIRDGAMYVNGAVLLEPYKELKAHGDFGPETVRAGNLFVLGDNRDQSNDSRYWGELPMANVQARAVMAYWPLNRVHLLN
jgi:signal peptidase I